MTRSPEFRGGKEAGSTRPLGLFFLSAAAIVLAAATLLYAQSERGDYTQRNLGSLAQPVVPAATDDAKYSVGSYPLYWPELEAGEGKGLVTGYCNTCHSPRYVLMQPPLTRDQWAAEVTKMMKTFGLEMPESDRAIVINYLAEHYSPETRKK
ncbi:MAG TPA: cytochrome c [Candidatus Acidoferrales bacterium]|nr:cytochrome c [Candidatus Acidoferrales bacterium]